MTMPNVNISKLLLQMMFFISGFCSLLYQTVWLRLAFTQFGVITPVVSVVISVFMLGLGLGSWAGGRYVSRWKKMFGGSAMSVYALIEIFIGFGALSVPAIFSLGGNFFTSSGADSSSWQYLAESAAVITVAMLPWSIAMGMTYPIVLEFLHDLKNKDLRSFSFLYAANTAGAFSGTILTVFVLIEVLGFRRTLMLAAACNFLIGLTAVIWGTKDKQKSATSESESQTGVIRAMSSVVNRNTCLVILFLTGFCSMAMEVAWMRSFSVQLGSVVYSFAVVLGVYLCSNWFGAFLYRSDLSRNKIKSLSLLISMTALSSVIPLIASCPKMWIFLAQPLTQQANVISLFLLPYSVILFSIVLGYLTPLLVDDLSQGDAAKAGTAYAINIFGCILGPICAGYVLLPALGSRICLILLVLPLAVAAFIVQAKKSTERNIQIGFLLACLVGLISSCFVKSWEEGAQLTDLEQKGAVLRRDYNATVISTNIAGYKALLVNGKGMTFLCTLVKNMVHLPMSFHRGLPKSVLVICFGMGTTFRSALSWDAKVTAVELSPSVKDAFGYYHADAASVLKNPNGHIVIDDGRRFLRRSTEKFDIITIDPPPPLEAAASSLLYSKEFYQLVQKHLNSGGILQQWYGCSNNEKIILQAALRSLVEVFPYVHMYPGVGLNGWHILASNEPFEALKTSRQMFAHMPEKAKKDLFEWSHSSPPEKEMEEYENQMLSNEVKIDKFLSPLEEVIITDDHPMNEYFCLRKMFNKEVFIGN